MKKNMLNMDQHELEKLQKKEFMRQDLDDMDRSKYNITICVMILITQLIGIFTMTFMCSEGPSKIFGDAYTKVCIAAIATIIICMFVSKHITNSIIGIINLLILSAASNYILIPVVSLGVCDWSAESGLNGMYEFAALLTMTCAIMAIIGDINPDWYTDTAKILLEIFIIIGICLLVSFVMGFYQSFMKYVILVLYASLLSFVLYQAQNDSSNLYSAIGWATAFYFYIAIIVYIAFMWVGKHMRRQTLSDCYEEAKREAYRNRHWPDY